MVRSRDEALAAVTARTQKTVADIATLLDKLIDATFDGSNTISLVNADLADAAVRTEIESQYQGEGWTVLIAEAPPGTWTISVT